MSTHNSDLPDDKLVAACQKGDVDAARILFERYSRAILGFIKNVLRKKGCVQFDHAEDVFQETWQRAYEKSAQVNQVFGGWLFRIARNTAIDHLRSGCVRQQRNEQSLDNLVLERHQATSVHEVIEHSLLAEEVLVIADQISEVFGKILRLRSVGADYATIAQKLGMSNNSVRLIYSRNLPRLKAEVNAATRKTRRKDNRYENLQ